MTRLFKPYPLGPCVETPAFRTVSLLFQPSLSLTIILSGNYRGIPVMGKPALKEARAQ